MKKITILLLILGVVFIGLTKIAVSEVKINYNKRYNKCYRNPLSFDIWVSEMYKDLINGVYEYHERYNHEEVSPNRGFICETDSKVCYLMGPSMTLLYCENK